MAAGPNWIDGIKREVISSKIEEAIHKADIITLKNGMEMEQHIFEKSTSKGEYYLFVASVVNKIQESGLKIDLPGPSSTGQSGVDILSEIPDLIRRGPCSVNLGGGRRKVFEVDLVPNVSFPSVRSGSILAPGGRSEQSEKFKGDYSWKTPAFRKSIIAKFDVAMNKYGRPTSKNSMEMEQLLFKKANSRDEYTGYVGRVLHHIKDVDPHLDGDETRTVSDISDLIPDPLSEYLTKKRGRRIHCPSFYYSAMRGTPLKLHGG